jgi:hypothetical protein
MADGDQNVVYVLNAENRFALFPGIGLTSSGGAYDGSVERYFDVDTSLFLSLSGEQIIDGQKTFALNPIIGTAEPVLTTGDQTVAGIKTFTDRPFVNGIGVVLSGDAAGIATPNDLTFGFGIESSGDFFNGSAAKTIAINSNEIVSITGVEEISGQKTFTLTPKVGSGTVILNTGEQTLSGKLIINNEFIQSGSLNIGGTGSGNFFGTSAILNSFGNSGQANNFGDFSILNSFGANTPTNEFGKLSVNKFGESGINTFYSGIFTGQTIFENNIMVGGGKPVMNTGVEIIGGLKTFSNDLVVEGDLILGHGNTIIYSDVDTIIGGSGNSLSGDASVILGGVNNRLSGDGSFIGVGTENKVSGVYSFLGGGSLNELFGDHNFIGAGIKNKITGSSVASTIVNGENNIISNSSGCAILGGIGNYVKSDYSFDYSSSAGSGSLWNNIGGGYENGIILSSNANFSAANLINGGAYHRIHDSIVCAIAGGLSNIISGNSRTCFIGAGSENKIISTEDSSVGGGLQNFISGGAGNSIFGGVNNRIISDSIIIYNSFIGGGSSNTIYDGGSSVVVGGYSNLCIGEGSFIGGGGSNRVSGDNGVVVCGNNNQAVGVRSTVLNGFSNIASGQYSTVLAGDGNQALASYSTVIGRRAITRTGDLGATVISDGQERDHYSRGAHTLSLDFFDGVYLRLPQFTGLSSQTGNRGEMAVSGDFLYVCTGSVSGWGRIQLSSF